MKKISIIIPVYNRERHLKECVNSILLSVEENVEIIIVDDGSTDRTPEICQELEKNNKAVKVVHQKNKGVASARNKGLEVATGEWIAWVDSDDLVDRNYIKTLNKYISLTNADIVIFGYQTFSNLDQLPFTNANTYSIREIEKEKCFEALGDISVGNFLWNKLFKKKLFNNIIFPDGKVYEDIATTYRLLDKAKKIVFSTAQIYFYRQHDDSIVHRKNDIKALQMLGNRVNAQYQLVLFLKNKYPRAYEIQNKLLIDLSFEYIKAEDRLNSSHTPTYFQCKKLIKEYRISLKRDGIKLCVKVTMCNYFFPLYKLIFRLHR